MVVTTISNFISSVVVVGCWSPSDRRAVTQSCPRSGARIYTESHPQCLLRAASTLHLSRKCVNAMVENREYIQSLMDIVPPTAHALLVQVHNLETLFLIEVYNQSHPPSLLRGASTFHFFPTEGKQTTLFAFPQSVFHSNMTPGTKGKSPEKK